MAYKVVVSRKAQLDVDEAINWYENQAKDLGIEFLLEFYSYSDFACQSPQLFGRIYKHYRKILPKNIIEKISLRYLLFRKYLKKRNRYSCCLAYKTQC